MFFTRWVKKSGNSLKEKCKLCQGEYQLVQLTPTLLHLMPFLVLSHQRLAHPNLVPLLGYSSDGDTLCLVYPYMPLGSLDYHLANVDLVGSQRITISKDVASALHYLHSLCGDVLVHRDVKRSVLMKEG